MVRIATVNDAEQLNIFKFQFCLEWAMPTTSQQVARCRGIRRIQVNTNMPACEQAHGRHIVFICAWLIAHA